MNRQDGDHETRCHRKSNNCGSRTKRNASIERMEWNGYKTFTFATVTGGDFGFIQKSAPSVVGFVVTTMLQNDGLQLLTCRSSWQRGRLESKQ